MPKDRKTDKKLKTSPIKVALLLVQFFLIKIGSAEIFVIKLLVRSLWFIVKPPINNFETAVRFLSKVQLKLHAPRILYQLPHRSRGRPRKSWFLPYYLNKLKLYIKRRISIKTKIAFVLAVIIFLVYIYTSFIFSAAYELPSPTRLVSTDKALTTEFFDRNGKLLYRMYEGRNRILVNLNELPSYLIEATLSIEDKNFYKHPGVDFVAIVRAILANLKKTPNPSGTSLEGASTITQQLIKNSLLTPEKTYKRKIKEIILALWAEKIYSKDEILKMYLNETPYGGPVWGVEAASETYFGKRAHDLTLAEASFLAGLPASPTQFSPYGTNPELGKLRQKEVLKKMVDIKYITQKQADGAFLEDLQLKPPIINIKAPHFVMYVKDLLSQKYGQRAISQGGLKIITSLDLDIQEKVEKIVSEEVNKLAPLNVKNGAAMVTDGKTGQILAMVGSKNYYDPQFGSFNVTLSLRQPGSSIKVVTYATAFKQGFSPGNTVLDTPVVFRDNWGNAYSPLNYDGAYHGVVSIRQALGSSYNIPAVKMLATVGVDEVINTARDLGITTFTDPKRYGLSLTLGGAEVKMIDMMTLYGALSQLGLRQTANSILKVTDSGGNVLEEYEKKEVQATSPEIAYLITDILADNNARKSAFGEKSQLLIASRSAAVKTGTSDNKRDNWTFGYTPDFVVGVWVGNNDNSPMNPALTSGVTGAAPIWNRIMTNLISDKPDKKFSRPANIVEARVDGRQDLVIAANVPKSLVRVAQKEDKTLFTDPYSSLATSSAQQEKQANQPELKDRATN